MNLGIVGTGKIVADALYAMQPIKEIKIRSIFARPRSLKKGEDFARKYDIPSVFTDYDEMLEMEDIDTVYIGLINTVHYEYAKRHWKKRKM